MIFGIGVDIADITRFQKFLDQANVALLERLFSEGERAACIKRKDAASRLAARFAAKEAFLKALGIGLRDGLSWHDVQICNDDLGKPELLLAGKAEEFCQKHAICRSFLSLSHDGGNAVAMVVLESK